jgi:hypothetical protein
MLLLLLKSSLSFGYAYRYIKPSPDGNGILPVRRGGQERYSVQQEKLQKYNYC